MAYNESAKVSEGQKQAELESIHHQFMLGNDRQVNFLQELEEKLHKIYSKKGPEKPTGAVEKSMPNDCISALNEQVQRLARQNDWLEKLLFHISEII